MVWSVYMRHWEDLVLITEYEMLCTLTCLKYVPTFVHMNAPVGNNLKPKFAKIFGNLFRFAKFTKLVYHHQTFSCTVIVF